MAAEGHPLLKSNTQGQTHWFAILMAVLVGQGAFLFGYEMGFSSPTGNFIQQQLNISDSSKDLAFALICIGAILGSLLAAPIADSIGRRKTLMLIAIPFIIGAILLCVELTYWSLCVSRIFSGIGVGAASVLVPLYITEIAPTHLRGALGTMNQFNITLGILVVDALGFYFDNSFFRFRVVVIFSLIFVLILVLGALFGPETPRWLLSQGRQNEAKEALSTLRQSKNVEDEFHEIYGHSDPDVPQVQASVSDLFVAPALQPFLMGVMLMVFQQWSGINALIFNIGTLTSKAGAVGFAACQVGCTLIAAFIMDRAGRRLFLILSATCMGISAIVFGILIDQNASDTSKVAAAVVYIASFSFGVGPIPWLICTELYPARVRSIAVSASTIVNWTMGFIVTMTFSQMQSTMGHAAVFYFYAAVCFAASVFVFFIVPETKGKTLEEVEKMFINRG